MRAARQHARIASITSELVPVQKREVCVCCVSLVRYTRRRLVCGGSTVIALFFFLFLLWKYYFSFLYFFVVSQIFFIFWLVTARRLWTPLDLGRVDYSFISISFPSFLCNIAAWEILFCFLPSVFLLLVIIISIFLVCFYFTGRLLCASLPSRRRHLPFLFVFSFRIYGSIKILRH